MADPKIVHIDGAHTCGNFSHSLATIITWTASYEACPSQVRASQIWFLIEEPGEFF